MAPLFRAVFHGCQAGRHQDALEHVYYAASEGETNYCMVSLEPWAPIWRRWPAFSIRPGESRLGLLPRLFGFRLESAGHGLRALGRLPDAVGPTRARSPWEPADIGITPPSLPAI